MSRDIYEAVLNLPKTLYVPPSELTLDPQKILLVDMGHAAVTSPLSVRPVLATTAVVSCIGIAVHNPRTKDTGLAHLVVSSEDYPELSPQNVRLLQRMMDAVRGEVQAPIEARIIGPHMGATKKLMDGIIGKLHQGGASIISADFGDKGGPRHFGVDPMNWNKGLLRGEKDWVDVSQTTYERMMAQMRESHILINELRSNPPGIVYDQNGFLDLREPRDGTWQILTP